jgi:hypothetical protein
MGYPLPLSAFLIIIKGSAVVVMNTTDYLREGLRQLQDRKFFKLLDHDPTEQHASEIDQVLLEMRGSNLITTKNLS